MDRGKVGDLGCVDRGGKRDRVLEREEEHRRRCRGRDDLDLERRLRRLELWWTGLGRRERRSGERGTLDFGLEVSDVGSGSGRFEGAGGVGSLGEGWIGCGGVEVGTGGVGASVSDVVGGGGAGGTGGGCEGGCLGKFSWKDC